MDKTGVLIERLLEQYHDNSSKEQLRNTTHLLLAELENKHEQQASVDNSVISVILPSSFNIITEREEIKKPAVIEVKEEKIKPEPVTALPEIKIENVAQPVDEKQAYNFFDPMIDIPTLALKQQEVNETITQQASLNDRFKQSAFNKEVAHNISNVPIKDLRKGIGINDQFLFINELFRGDQIMYDRSIKTINSFNIYGEAELWIKRELKLKLGWNEESHASALFDQLVRRRFS